VELTYHALELLAFISDRCGEVDCQHVQQLATLRTFNAFRTELHYTILLLAHELNREPEALAQNYRNWTIQFQKPDPPILSILAVVTSAASVDDEALPLTKRRLDGREGRPWHTQGDAAAATRSN
jgi:hypothetical protein